MVFLVPCATHGRAESSRSRVVLLLAGCTSVHRNPVPVEMMDRADIPGTPGGPRLGRPSRANVLRRTSSSRYATRGEEAGPGKPAVEWPSLLLSGGGAQRRVRRRLPQRQVCTPAPRPYIQDCHGHLHRRPLLPLSPFSVLLVGPRARAPVHHDQVSRQIFRIRNPLTILQKGLAHPHRLPLPAISGARSSTPRWPAEPLRRSTAGVGGSTSEPPTSMRSG